MSKAQRHPSAECFYKTALEYYVSGRAALHCLCSLVAGNLIHHAVEMLMKGKLSKTIPLEDLKKQFGHKLPKSWKAFKNLFPAENLTEFDAMIAELGRFEEIRYSDKILDDGVFIGLGFGRGKPSTIDRGKPIERPEPEYQVGLGDVDAFFARLFSLCDLNPKAYFSFLSPQGRQALVEGNAESNDWLP